VISSHVPDLIINKPVVACKYFGLIAVLEKTDESLHPSRVKKKRDLGLQYLGPNHWSSASEILNKKNFSSDLGKTNPGSKG
jgi:hypothetical protein